MGSHTLKVLWFALAAGLIAGPAREVSAQTPSTATASPGTVIKVSVKLVQVDATVTDEKGQAVRDLKAQDAGGGF